ncbi:MAG: tRNA uridine-5-carboxymethylaminomethyl(34) synthesis GTPase MnmE [Prevotella sp.]|nr:tRNA uridine-5-carboxymethylaminomethyl(34) synthesis GTPase MnmE [Prevotella sp.]
MSTICAIATASGGALGVIRLSGSSAIDIADSVFRGKRSPAGAHPASVLHGLIVDGEEVIDEVLLSVFRAPHSYTGEDCVEISCHASPYILQRIITLLIHHGCRMAEPGEFTKRAFLGGKMDLSQAEAVADLIASETRAQHRMAMNQMRGGYSEKLRSLRDKLLQMTSLLELELDFSEEDVQFAPRKELLSLCLEVEQKVQSLVSSFRDGNAIKQGVPVAIIGKTNVGKSTLLNTLLGENRAIVSDTQGTTRDIIEDTITIDGILFRFIDTAGIRHTDNKVEKLGIERSFRAAEKARIIIMMRQPGGTFPTIPLREDQDIIRIVNKTKTFQALTGQGVENLKQQLVAIVTSQGSQPHNLKTSQPQNLIVTNIRHYEALRHALSDIRSVRKALNEGTTAELIAEELRACLHHLAEITGEEITTEEVLNNIFSHFCIGK